MRAVWGYIQERQVRATAHGLFTVALVVAGCVRKTHDDQPVPGEPVDAGVDAARITPTEAGTDAGSDTPTDAIDGGAIEPPQDCPGRDEPRPATCENRFIELPFVQGAIVALPDGAVVEALQIPAFTEANHAVTFEHVPPERWDRTAMPAGACVFRLHGLHASCYVAQNYGLIFFGGCRRDLPRVSPGGYYENGCQPVAPGCTTANWGGTDGYWWYLNSRPDAIDVVICAPQCHDALSSGMCLELRGPG